MPSPLNYFLAIPVAIFTFFVVFVKINGRPSTNFLKNLLVYASNPKTRIWHKGESNVRVEIYQPRAAKTDLHTSRRYSKAEIEKVAEIIDKRGRVNPPVQ